MRILLTAFEPFGGSDLNPSMLVTQSISRTMPWVTTLVLPVVSGTGSGSAWSVLGPALEDPWDSVVHLGESARSGTIMVERVAVNLRDSIMPDNDGVMLRDEPVVQGGPAALFATLPVRSLVDASMSAGVPAAPSLSAGTFLCNETMYRSLHRLEADGRPTTAGFVHVPQLPQQAALRGGMSMEPADMIVAISAMLSRLRDGPRLGPS